MAKPEEMETEYKKCPKLSFRFGATINPSKENTNESSESNAGLGRKRL